MAAFVASQARSTTSSSFAADLDDSDDSDDDSDDEPKIRPVYRTQSGRGIRMRAADRACAPVPATPLPSAAAHSFGPPQTSVCTLAGRRFGSLAAQLIAPLQRIGGLRDPRLRARFLRLCVDPPLSALCAPVRQSCRELLMPSCEVSESSPRGRAPPGRCAVLQRLW